MVAFTTARGLYQVANSSYVGTWDVPENSNWGVVDAALGQITTIQLNNTPVTLSAAQVQCCQLIFSSSAAPGGNLAGNVAITFPTVSPSSTELTGPYIIQNLCGNSSLFVVTLQTTVAGGQAVACKPGEAFDVINDGTNFKFKNLGHIGSYWDYVGSSVPNWVTGCTVPPYLNCDGTTFSSATYPTLTSIMGTTLPDTRGRDSIFLNQGTGRTTTINSALDGDTLFATGGSGTLTTLVSSQIPVLSTQAALYRPGTNAQSGIVFTALGDNSALTIGTSNNASFNPLVPSYVSGIRMVRAG